MALEVVRSEDFIEYFLFPDVNEAEASDKETILKDLHQKINEISKSYASKYIWHKDPFEIRSKTFSSILSSSEGNEHLPPHLYGISHFGDNIQDEWFIVSLLYHISRELPSIIIRTCDSDGEFLLIEAADHLPQWANPETCEQRVYINNGHLHLISGNENETLSVEEGVKSIRGNPTKYIVSKDIEDCINERIKAFPASLEDNLHRQTVYLPLGVAALLQHNPQLIAPAVQAFCNRDPIDMKACRAMRYFPPEDRVYTSVVFTKCLYAMIMHNNYLPDRRTGWNIPPSSSPHFKAHLLGVKIACGFEILASQAKSSTVDFEKDREWQKYLESLKSKNYFQNELEGSKKYQELLIQAKEFYQENRDAMKSTHIIGDEILKNLKQLDINQSEFKKQEESLPASDSDNWLHIAPEELDEMLQKRYGIKDFLTHNSNISSGELTEMLSGFLDKESEFDGVDVDMNENVSNLLKSVASAVEPVATASSSSKKSTKIDFDADAFCSNVQNLLDLVIPEDKWDSQSDMSDYENDDDLLAKNIDEISKNRFVKGRKKKDSIGKADKTKMDAYMNQMDRELAGTTIGKSFEKKTATKASHDDEFDDFEDFQPVDIDVNAVKNMMESYKLQGASAGPTSNLLASILSESKKQTDV